MTTRKKTNVPQSQEAPRLSGVRIAVDGRTLSQPGMGIHGYLKVGLDILIREGADIVLLTNRTAVGEYPGARWETFGSRRDIIWDQFDLPKHLRKRKFQYYWAPANNGVPLLPIGKTVKVGTTHDLIPLRLPRMYLLRRPGFALSYLVWTSTGILRSDVLLTVSQSSARDIRAMFHRRATVVTPAFSVSGSTEAMSSLNHGLEGLEYLVYVGGMDFRKNVMNLLRAFAISVEHLPQLHLVMIGHSTEGLKPTLAQLGLTNNVILTGFVSDEERTAILSGAHAMVYPSLYEGFGLPILEAFAANVPVLTCRNSSLVEVAGDAAIYVDPLSPESISRGIEEILEGNVANHLRELGKVRLTRFDPEQSSRRLVDVFARSE
jgi:glycosyltransferase involved in cell wall biosynthesis